MPEPRKPARTMTGICQGPARTRLIHSATSLTPTRTPAHGLAHVRGTNAAPGYEPGESSLSKRLLAAGAGHATGGRLGVAPECATLASLCTRPPGTPTDSGPPRGRRQMVVRPRTGPAPAPAARPHIPGRRADDLRVLRLFQDVGAPADHPGRRERRREHLARQPAQFHDHARVELHVGVQLAARLQLGEDRLDLPLDLDREVHQRAAEAARRCPGACANAGPRCGRPGGRSP